MGKNQPGVFHYVNVAVPGEMTIELDEDQAAEYNTDPDAYAARYLGLAKFEYLLMGRFGGEHHCAERGPRAERFAEMRSRAALGCRHPNGWLGIGGLLRDASALAPPLEHNRTSDKRLSAFAGPGHL